MRITEYKEWKEYKSTFYLKKCDAGGMVKPVMNYVFPLGIRRYYDGFDYVSWLNVLCKDTEVQ